MVAMALTGSVLLFKDDLRRVTVEVAASPVITDPGRLGMIMNEAQSRYGSDLRYVRFASEEFGLAEAILKNGGAYLDRD